MIYDYYFVDITVIKLQEIRTRLVSWFLLSMGDTPWRRRSSMCVRWNDPTDSRDEQRSCQEYEVCNMFYAHI